MVAEANPEDVISSPVVAAGSLAPRGSPPALHASASFMDLKRELGTRKETEKDLND